ncbi:hypothetical protein HJFPF1_00216 [Paramyrothecium foliicola]|nr:hypothetical protein HJFPF1_00216 [Paramyrothecium foliicola]
MKRVKPPPLEAEMPSWVPGQGRRLTSWKLGNLPANPVVEDFVWATAQANHKSHEMAWRSIPKAVVVKGGSKNHAGSRAIVEKLVADKQRSNPADGVWVDALTNYVIASFVDSDGGNIEAHRNNPGNHERSLYAMPAPHHLSRDSWGEGLKWLVSRQLGDLTQADDPRVGSGRDDSDGGGTLSTASTNKTSSLAKLGATFIPVLIYLAVCLVVFIVLRPRCRRVYAPRTIEGLQTSRSTGPALPSGWFNWVIPFFKVPDTYVLNHGSLDGFFFLRYLKVLRNISVAGCLIVWPILLPINGTGGNGQEQLDALTIGNVKDQRKLFAHAVVAWIFFGFVLFTVVRECIYYVNLRQAYLSSPYYANRLSSRTMMITCVPSQYLDERRLRKLYGDSAKRIWIPRTMRALVNLVKEREQTALRLEKAEIQLIRKANLARAKHLRQNPDVGHPSPAGPVHVADGAIKSEKSDKDGNDTSPSTEITIVPVSSRTNSLPTQGIDSIHSQEKPEEPSGSQTGQDDDYVHPYGLDPALPDVRGSVAALWIPVEARPHHRPLANFGRRVDTIRWTRDKLKELNMQIWKLRRAIRRGDGIALPAAFIEFDTQESAQAAQQTLVHHRPLQMSTRLLGIRADEVIWDSLRMSWWERIVRRTLIFALIIAAIIFWSIPSAFVGIVSNVDFLSNIAFLSWISKLPKPILGFLGGFIPALALSLFMSLVPMMLRFCAAQAGVPSLILAELFCQKAYFAFQVVQVFLITTLTSAASGAFFEVLQDPMKATNLLAKNLPRASNFYLSYILIQCLAAGGTNLLHLLDLIRHHLFIKIISIPRSQHRLWRRLRPVHWGGVFPVFTNMGVIALSYACVAPLVLVFAAGGMAFMHIVWRYNLIYVFDSDMDSKGLFYPQALTQLIVGLYMAEVCLIGLFALNKAFGPMVLIIMLLLFSGIVHMNLSEAIAPLVQSLPQTLTMEEEIREEEKALAAAANEVSDGHGDSEPGGAANDYYDTEQAFGDEMQIYNDHDEEDAEEYAPDSDHTITGSRGVEGAGSLWAIIREFVTIKTKSKLEVEAEESGLNRLLRKIGILASDDPHNSPPPWLGRWLHPEVYEDFLALRKLIPDDVQSGAESPEQQDRQRDYLPPELWLPKTPVWIPRDEARVSRQEVAHTKPCAPTSDVGARLDEKGRVIVDVEAAPFPLEERRGFL